MVSKDLHSIHQTAYINTVEYGDGVQLINCEYGNEPQLFSVTRSVDHDFGIFIRHRYWIPTCQKWQSIVPSHNAYTGKWQTVVDLAINQIRVYVVKQLEEMLATY